ncbi:MAG: endonuclease/exonuclease/phosphatase family protein [Deltaproteobacteria bacterium]|nr:endonuclease/exonuclease/phosphatase family protein [Deltaproteobacteria bacterium]
MQVRVGSFNLENLFNRYALLDEPWQNRDYDKVVAAYDIASIASRDGDLVSYELTQLQRNNTALAIEHARPDILVVQEVENLIALRTFNDKYLDDYFDRLVLVDGNDPRGIDVGLLIRAGFQAEIVGVRTHIDDNKNGKQGGVKRSANRAFGFTASNAIFSRDCLEVDVKVGGVVLTLLANHLKAQDGKASSVTRRLNQSKRVAALVDANIAAGRKPIVLGDLNIDSKAKQYDKSLDPLVKHKKLADTDPAGDWTHYYASKKSVSRLDYILADKTLTAGPIEIVRDGLTTKCKQYTGNRFPTIGPEHTEASDHCAVVVPFDV